jgi:hypothetical protein
LLLFGGILRAQRKRHVFKLSHLTRVYLGVFQIMFLKRHSGCIGLGQEGGRRGRGQERKGTGEEGDRRGRGTGEKGGQEKKGTGEEGDRRGRDQALTLPSTKQETSAFFFILWAPKISFEE